MRKNMLTVMAALTAFVGAAREAKPVNVVLLLADDQGYGDLRCYGNPKVTTPNIDRLASEGTLFTDFYAGAAASTPSRGALLTGRYAERMGVPDVVDDTSDNGINPGELTIADYLKQRGYATGMFGKWHLGYQPEYMPTRHGFTEFYGLPYSMDMWPFHPAPDHHYRPLPLYDGEEVVEYNPPVNEMTTRLTEKAVDFIDRHSDGPFFLYVPYTQPHVPLGVSDKFRGRSGEGLYADVLMELDWSVGEIVKALDERGLGENTLVLFTSDNGPWLSYGDHAGTTLGLREGKGTTFEGGQRVPLVARMKGTVPAGKRSRDFFSAIDFAPTIIAMTGAAMPGKNNNFDGQDVSELLRGGKVDHKPFFFNYNGKVEAVRDGKYKLVAPHSYRIVAEPGRGGCPGKQIIDGAATPLALYDLEKDPYEKNDISKQKPEVAKRLSGLVEKFQAEMDREMEQYKKDR